MLIVGRTQLEGSKFRQNFINFSFLAKNIEIELRVYENKCIYFKHKLISSHQKLNCSLCFYKTPLVLPGDFDTCPVK